MLLGDTIWEGTPSALAQQEVAAGPHDFPDVAGLVAVATDHGFEVIDGHVSTLEEWDDYEWSWTGSLARWALAQPESSEGRAIALGASAGHRNAWLSGYRKELGFACVGLQDVVAQG